MQPYPTDMLLSPQTPQVINPCTTATCCHSHLTFTESSFVILHVFHFIHLSLAATASATKQAPTYYLRSPLNNFKSFLSLSISSLVYFFLSQHVFKKWNCWIAEALFYARCLNTGPKLKGVPEVMWIIVLSKY